MGIQPPKETNELFKKLVNVSHISVELADKRIVICVFQLNYKKDVELEPLLKRKPLLLQYYLFEAFEVHAAIIPYKEQQVATEFPPTEQLYKPFGVEFM
jgi:hypothetical protein